MAIYVRPGGNDANGGTNATTDALQTMTAAIAKFNRNDPNLRDIIVCADTPGGTGNFTGGSNRFFNNNQSLWQFGTSESERMSIQGRAGDTIVFTPHAVNWWFLFSTVCQWFTLSNFEINQINMTANGDPGLKVYGGGSSNIQKRFNIFSDLIFRNGYRSNFFMDAGCTDNLAINCESYDAGRMETPCNCYYWSGGHRNRITKSIAGYSIAPGTHKGGIRIGINAADFPNGYTDPTDNIIDRNMSWMAGANYVFNGKNLIIRNNWSRRCLGNHYQLYVSGTSDDNIKFYNNAGYDQNQSGYRGFYISTGGTTNTQYTNNIMAGITNPTELSGDTFSENLTNLTADPGWGDPDNNNFTLTASATTAVNQGTDKRTDVPDDFYETVRFSGAGMDIGPFELVEAQNPNPVSGPYINVGALTCPRTYVFLGGSP